MLEIFLVRWLYGLLAGKAEQKGRPRSWGWLGVAFWFGGEVMGFIVGGALNLGAGGYAIALVFAAIGAVVSNVVVGSLPAAVDPAL